MLLGPQIQLRGQGYPIAVVEPGRQTPRCGEPVDVSGDEAGRVLAEINKAGFCGNDWAVGDDGSLQKTDLLFIGLIHHTILRRNAAAA